MEKYKIIKIKAIEKNYTYKNLAENIGTSEQTITNWVNNRNTNNINKFIKLCKLLNIEIKDL